jgi:putative hemolysin
MVDLSFCATCSDPLRPAKLLLVSDPSSSHVLWLGLAIGVLVYRAAMAALLAAYHAVPSLHRRRLLEEKAIPNPLLARLLADPRTLGMGLTLWNQFLLVLLLALIWPLRTAIPGGAWVLAGVTLAYLWAMDLALPSLLTATSPADWLIRLFPFYAPVHALMLLLVAPIARMVERKITERERVEANAEEDLQAEDAAVTALIEEGEAEGILEERDRELIRNVVSFGDTVVREVMTPRTRVHALPHDANWSAMWKAFIANRHSRLPVFEGGIDHIVGVVLLKDLMRLPDHDARLAKDLMKPPLFVPESKPVADLLKDLQRARTQLAVVVDEFGAVSGIVTIEDLLEEVFGEIQDEHESRNDIQEQSPGIFIVNGQAHVEDVAAHLGLNWERDGFDTLAGFVLARLGRVPNAQESVVVEGAKLTVMRMEGTRISQVRVDVQAPPPMEKVEG